MQVRKTGGRGKIRPEKYAVEKEEEGVVIWKRT